jgi:hypothetical protein
MKRVLGLALVLLLAAAPGVFAQQTAGGNIYGTVMDASAAVLPGVNVALEGDTGTQNTVSGAQGAFRFLNLNRGDYTLSLSFTGFATLTRAVVVTTGESVQLDFTMKVSTIEETIEVMGETPLVNTKKRGTATTMTSEELSAVPNARDPWGVLKAVPGVLVDRVNIAGNENGQQAGFAGKGATDDDSTWNLDGLVISDMSATGASPTYYDFDVFQEINVTTGGADLQVQAGGIGINMTTKRGTNTFHGGLRYILAHNDLSFGNLPSSLDNDPRLVDDDGNRRNQADNIRQISDYGFDLGGPILKDKLWFFGTWGRQDIRLQRLIGTPDKTILTGMNAKLNWQAGSNTMVSAFWFEGKKQKFGREAGWGVQSADSFNWDQDNAYEDTVGGPDRPIGLWKLQVDHTFSPDFFMSVNGAYYNTGFTLTPRGGLDQSYTIDYVQGDAIGSFWDYTAVRPQWHFNINGNYFFEGLGGQNELKFGFGYRDMQTTSGTNWGGNELPGFVWAADSVIAWIPRDVVVKYAGKYSNAYLGDVFTKDRFTFNVGIRWDGQKAKNLPSEAPANASFPDIVPGLSYEGSDDIIDWSTWSPRIGLSYALNESRKTVLRASYANYADQLPFGDVTIESPLSYGYLAYGWEDTNGDRFVQSGEVQLDNFQYNVTIDPANPGAAEETIDKIDRNLSPQRDHEFVLGIDHELGANFAVGFAYTFRNATNWMYTPRLASPCPSATNCAFQMPSDYQRNDPVTANGYTAFTYSPNPDLVDASSGGRYRTNADGYRSRFHGFEITAVKRLSNKWMGRVAFSYNSWKEYWDGMPYALIDDDGNPTSTETDQNVDGGNVSVLSGGSGKASFYTNVPWQLYANALYQFGWDIDLSGALFAKSGGAYPVSVVTSMGSDGSEPALATGTSDKLRYETVTNLDLRLAKTFRFGRTGLVVSAEWFNVFNSSLVLSRYRFATGTAFTATESGATGDRGRIEEIISPSIFRIGARFTF